MADSLAESHLNRTVHAAGAAAEFAAECKVRKYTDLSRSLLSKNTTCKQCGLLARMLQRSKQSKTIQNTPE